MLTETEPPRRGPTDVRAILSANRNRTTKQRCTLGDLEPIYQSFNLDPIYQSFNHSVTGCDSCHLHPGKHSQKQTHPKCEKEQNHSQEELDRRRRKREKEALRTNKEPY